ncbi:MAG: formate dehydrogenase accessory protein FdhE [Thermoflexales bacterium]
MAKVAPLTPEVAAIHKRLDDLQARYPDLAEPIAFYRESLPLLRQAETAIEAIALPAGRAGDKLAMGMPVLVGEDLPLDVDATRALILQLCKAAESFAPPAPSGSTGAKGNLSRLFKRGQPDALKVIEAAQVGDGGVIRTAAAEQIRRAIEREELSLIEVFAHLAMGDWRRVEIMAHGLRLDAEMLRVLAQDSLKPALRVWARGVQADTSEWKSGACPLCGSPPALSEIRGKEGARRLRCGMCGTSWHYPRLQCAFCANDDHRHLGRLMVQGEHDKYYAQTCDVCRGYNKIVVTFDAIPVDFLAIEDLATLHLDYIASEAEYARVPVGAGR